MKKWLIFTGISILIILLSWNAEYLVSRASSIIIGSNIEDSPGQAPEGTYPVILLHGYTGNSIRIAEWSLLEMQENLAEDLNYQEKGIYVPETTCAELRYDNRPTIIRATFYEDYFQEDIDEYTHNLAQIIERVLYCTGAGQVDIVTHSMGGVVSRNYIKNAESEDGDANVRKLIMIGTPNHGGLYNGLELLKELPGEDYDFLQLQDESEFMMGLNEGDETPGDTQYYTIVGNVDGEGDGIVLASSVSLEGQVNGTTVDCNHVTLNSPSICEEGYDFVVESLKD